MKYYSVAFSLLIISGCAVLQNGVSYLGEEKIFSKSWRGNATYARAAQGREPGWEVGFSFITSKEARIKGIWIKNPTAGSLPVSIWDAATKQLLHTFQLTVSDTVNYNHFILNQPVPLTANKKYCITINVIKYYYHTLPFTILPTQVNNCTLLSSVYEEIYYQRYPQYEINNVIHGLIDVDLDWKQ
jgi:Domain of unknown function (DUF4082)